MPVDLCQTPGRGRMYLFSLCNLSLARLGLLIPPFGKGRQSVMTEEAQKDCLEARVYTKGKLEAVVLSKQFSSMGNTNGLGLYGACRSMRPRLMSSLIPFIGAVQDVA